VWICDGANTFRVRLVARRVGVRDMVQSKPIPWDSGLARRTQGSLAPGGTEKDAEFVRFSIDGSFFPGSWEAMSAPPKTSRKPTLTWRAYQDVKRFSMILGAQVKYLRAFAFSIGRRYQETEPMPTWYLPREIMTCALTKTRPSALLHRTETFFQFTLKRVDRCAQVDGGRLDSDYRHNVNRRAR
jgi:hypothetical protein